MLNGDYMKYDLIIIGAGPAGITAAIYAKRSGLNVLLLEKKVPGGMLNYVSNVDNFPGEINISGPDLAFKMFEHIRISEVEFKNKGVERVILENGYKKVIVSDDEYYLTKNLIIATGRVPKKLGLENETELLGKGISSCAICDGPLYKDMDVLVVGGGNSALEEAIYLSNICNKVYLVHRRDKFKAEAPLINCLEKRNNIECLMESRVTKINSSNGVLSSVIINDDIELKVAAMFTYVGFIPSTNFVSTLNITDENGYIEVDENYESREKGIYAVGDIIKKDIYQIVTSCGEGAVAAISVARSVDGN